MATVIHTENLAVSFDGETPIFEGLNVAVEKGEFVTLVGVSGAGKSTFLRVVADLIPPFKGSVKVDTADDPARRPIAMVFQAANLMPWRRVKDNVTLGLEGIEVSDTIKRERIEWTLDLVGLKEYGDRWPYQLSGGQRQRIGIARALAVDPDLLLNRKIGPVCYPRYRGSGLSRGSCSAPRRQAGAHRRRIFSRYGARGAAGERCLPAPVRRCPRGPAHGNKGGGRQGLKRREKRLWQ